MNTLLNSIRAGALACLVFSYPVTAMAAYGGQCVQYVKSQAPNGYDWTAYLAVKDGNGRPFLLLNTAGKPVKATAADVKLKKPTDPNGYLYKNEVWTYARDIYSKYYGTSTSPVPSINSVMVLDSFSGSTVGHVAIVTDVSDVALSKTERQAGVLSKVKVSVKHSNWRLPGDAAEQISTGYFTVSYVYTNNRVIGTATYNNGTTKYPVLGYVFKPN